MMGAPPPLDGPYIDEFDETKYGLNENKLKFTVVNSSGSLLGST